MANSRKLSGRCVAGLRVDGSGWLRPVSDTSDGTLTVSGCRLNDGSQVKPLDIFEIEVTTARPESHQPENWVVSADPWERVTSQAHQALELVENALIDGPALLGGTTDRIAWASLVERPAAQSLAVVKPQEIDWRVTTSLRGNRQTRAQFYLAGAYYDLVVTDSAWEARLRDLSLGTHDSRDVGIRRNDRVLFTVSLGEPFGGDCYKLVAAVMVIS